MLLKMVDLNGEELGLIRYSVYFFLFLNSVWIHFFILQRGKKEIRIVAGAAKNKLSVWVGAGIQPWALGYGSQHPGSNKRIM